jgi:hypothetical protein
MSASVIRTYAAFGRACAAWRSPSAIAHSLPVHPGGKARADHLERTRVVGRKAPGDGCGRVLAVVVDQDHGELARIILGEQRAKRLLDVRRLVARRDDRDHLRPRRG